MSSSTAAAGFPPLSTALKTDTNPKAAVREFIQKCELGYICGYLRKYMHGSIRNYVL